MVFGPHLALLVAEQLSVVALPSLGDRSVSLESGGVEVGASGAGLCREDVPVGDDSDDQLGVDPGGALDGGVAEGVSEDVDDIGERLLEVVLCLVLSVVGVDGSGLAAEPEPVVALAALREGPLSVEVVGGGEVALASLALGARLGPGSHGPDLEHVVVDDGRADDRAVVGQAAEQATPSR